MDITILTPLYNGIEFLEETVDSVIAQTYPHWRMIIGVNGHGEDGGTVAAQAYAIAAKDSRIHVLIQPPPISGKPDSLNGLIANVKTEWTCLLDADDKWLPEKLEKQMEIIQSQPNLGVVGTFCRYFGLRNNAPELIAGALPRRATLSNNPIINSSSIFRTKYGKWAQLFDIEDYELWLRLDYLGVQMYNIPEILVLHRIHHTSSFNSQGVSPHDLVTLYKSLNWDNPTPEVDLPFS